MAEKIDLNKIIDLAGIKAGFSELDRLLSDAANQAAAFGDAMSKARNEAGGDISKLREEIARLNAELAKQKPSTKQGQQAIGDLGRAISNTGKEYEDATKNVKNFDKANEAVAGSLDDVSARLKEAKKEFAAISEAANPAQFAQAAQKVSLLAAEQKRLRDQLKATSRSLGGINENLKFSENSYNAVRANIKKYKAELGDAEIGSREFLRAEAKLNAELEKEIQLREKQPSLFAKRIRQAAGESKEVKALSDRLRKLRKELVSAPSDTVFDEISKDIKKVEGDIDSLLSKQRTGGGAGGGGLLSQVFGGVIAGGAAGVAQAGFELLVDGLRSVAAEIQEITPQLRTLQTLTGQTGQQLADTAGTVRGVAETFGREFDDIAQAANTLSKEFGGDFEENTLAIADALAFDVTGEAIDSIREYSTQVRSLGGTQEDLIKIAQLQGREGFFSDKFFDTIKEGGLRLGELTKGGQDALASLGDTGKEVQRLFSEGEQFKAIQLLSKETANLAKEGKNVQPIIANLFGGAGEDLGIRGLEILGNLGNINVELTDLQQQQKDILDSRIEFEQSLTTLASEFTSTGGAFTVFFNQLKTFGVETLTEFIRFFKELGGDIVRIFGFFSDGNSTLFETIKGFTELNPVVLQIKLGFEVAAKAVRFLIDGIKRLIAFGAALDEALGSPIERFANFTIEAFTRLNKDTKSFVKTLASGLSSALSSVGEFTTRAVSTILGGFDKVRESLGVFGDFLPEDTQARFNAFAKEVSEGFTANLKALSAPEVKDEAEKAGEEVGKAISRGLNREIKKGVKDVRKEIPKVSLIQPLDNEQVQEVAAQVDDLSKQNAERVAENNRIARELATGEEFRRREELEKQAATLGNALADKTQEKLLAGIDARYNRQIEAARAAGASQEVIDRLEARRQRRRAQQEILFVTLRAGAEAFIAAIKDGKTPAEAAGAAGQAGAIAAALGTIQAFEKGGLVEGKEQIVRINEKGQEFVINAETTKKHLAFLHELNAGKFDGSISPVMAVQADARSKPARVAAATAQRIDYDKLGRAVAKYTQKLDIHEEANRIVLHDETRAKIKRLEIERASILPKLGNK